MASVLAAALCIIPFALIGTAYGQTATVPAATQGSSGTFTFSKTPNTSNGQLAPVVSAPSPGMFTFGSSYQAVTPSAAAATTLGQPAAPAVPLTFQEKIYRSAQLPIFTPLTPPGMPSVLNVQVKGGETFEFDDNPLLVTSGAHTLMGSTTSPELVVSGGTPTLHVDADTRLDIGVFDQPGFSSNDIHTTAHAIYDHQLLFAKFTGSLDYDTTRTSELTLSGVNVAGVRHTGYTLAPEIGYRLSSRDQIVLDGSYNVANYDNLQLYNNYEIYSVRPVYIHSISPQDTLTTAFGVQRYQTTSGQRTVFDSLLPSLAWSRQFDPRLSGSVEIGFAQTHIQSVNAVTPDHSDYFYNAQLSYAYLTDRFNFTLSRNLVPSGSGTEITQTSVGPSVSHQFSSRGSATVSLLYQTDDYENVQLGNQTSFLSASLAANYHITQTLSLSATYRYRRRESFQISSAAASNAVLLSLVFSPDPIAPGL